MSTLPRRAARDARAFVSSPLAIMLAVLFFAGAATTLAFFPREGATGAAATTGTDAGSADRVRTVPGAVAARPVDRAERRRESPDRQGSTTSNAAVPSGAFRDRTSARQVSGRAIPGRSVTSSRITRSIRSATPTCRGGPHPSACDAAVAVRLAKAKGREDAMIKWCSTISRR